MPRDGTNWVTIVNGKRHRADDIVEGLTDLAYVWDMQTKKREPKVLKEYLRKFRKFEKQEWGKPTWLSDGEWFRINEIRRRGLPPYIKQGLNRGNCPRGLAPGVIPQDERGRYRCTVAHAMEIYYREGIGELPSVRHLRHP